MGRRHKFKLLKQQKQQQQQQSRRKLQQLSTVIGLITILTTIIAYINAAAASQDLLPHICDSVKCPPLSEITCPEDSDVRDTSLPLAAALLSPMMATSAETTSSSPDDTLYNSTINSISESIYAQCCLSKKCICKTCYIPDCHEKSEVVIELVPESLDTPGHCCGQYTCQLEPNCSKVINTETYWLADCQRCRCFSGERICHQSCDEGMRKSTAICNSKTLNTFFLNGDTWRDGCYDCECVNGEEKCVMPFCRSINCPTNRQVLPKDSCCPICWPKGLPMPNGDEDYDEGTPEDHDIEESLRPLRPFRPLHPHPIDNYNSSGNEIDSLLPNIDFEKDITNPPSSTIETPIEETKESVAPSNLSEETKTLNGQSVNTTTTTTTPIATVWEIFGSNATTTSPDPIPPCMSNNNDENPDRNSATYQVFPKMVHPTDHSYLHYSIIGILCVITAVMIVWNIHLRAKQRSYCPVSNCDDNFNKASPNLKKVNNCV